MGVEDRNRADERGEALALPALREHRPTSGWSFFYLLFTVPVATPTIRSGPRSRDTRSDIKGMNVFGGGGDTEYLRPGCCETDAGMQLQERDPDGEGRRMSRLWTDEDIQDVFGIAENSFSFFL